MSSGILPCCSDTLLFPFVLLAVLTHGPLVSATWESEWVCSLFVNVPTRPCRSWQGPFLFWSSPPVDRQTLETASNHGRERKQVLFRVSPAQMWLHLMSGEFPQRAWWTQGQMSFHLRGWRRPSGCCYQNSFPHPEERKIKDEEEETPRCTLAYWVKAESSIFLKGW